MKNFKKQVLQYQREIERLEDELLKLPSGSLARKGKFYYHHHGIEVKGITKNEVMIRQLCRKRYVVERRKSLIEFLKHPFKTC